MPLQPYVLACCSTKAKPPVLRGCPGAVQDEMEEVGPMLAKIKSKELVAEWKEKGEKKGLFGRKSIDK